MSKPLPYMGLTMWEQTEDLYDHAQLANNFARIDAHDHTPGRGVQITTESIAAGTIVPSHIASVLPWTNATLENSWTNVGGAFSVVSYVKDTMGFVHLRGVIKGGTSGTVAFTLPAGFRPVATVSYPLVGAEFQRGFLRVATTGKATIEYNTSDSNTAKEFGLATATFLAEA